MKNKYDQTLEARLEINKANLSRVDALHAQGFSIDQTLMLKERVDHLTTHMLGGYDNLDRQLYELTWEQHVATILDNVEVAARKEKLKVVT